MARKLIIAATILLAGITAFSCMMIAKELKQSKKESSEFEALSAVVEEIPQETPVETPKEELPSQTEEQEKPAAIHKRNLQPLFDENPDCIGWLCIPDSNLDYPVMHTPDEPQKYLRKAFNGEYSISGVPFLNDSSTQESDNLVIYGHSMNNGTMFTDVIKYRNKSYWESHPSIEWETADGLSIFDVFAAVQLKENDMWYFFDSFEDEEQHQELLAHIMSMALYDTGLTPEYGQQLMTLSTCYGSSDDDRIIIIAMKRAE